MLKRLSILKSLFILSLISVVGFMATQALFIDREKSKESSFVVGTLDMTVNGPGSAQAESIQVTGVGAEHVSSGGKSWVINNVGSLPGLLSFDIVDLHNFENDCNEPEALEDTSCADPGENQGELGGKIITSVLLKDQSGERLLFSSDLSPQHAEAYGSLWQQHAGDVIVPAGKSVTLTFNWTTENSQYANEIQSDSVTFTALFNLRQVLNTPATPTSP